MLSKSNVKEKQSQEIIFFSNVSFYLETRKFHKVYSGYVVNTVNGGKALTLQQSPLNLGGTW
jgi:hypothetical protein